MLSLSGRPHPVCPPLPREDVAHVLAHTRADWDQLRGGRLFVTGATGLFGVWLLETFAYANEVLGLGARLVGLSRQPEAFLARVPHLARVPSISFHRGDVRAFRYPEGRFTHLIHAAATPGPSQSATATWDTITEGTRRALEWAVAVGTHRVLLVSSGAVYGAQPEGMTRLSETYRGRVDPSDAGNAYALGKQQGEELAATWYRDQGLETTIARCFAVVGPHLPLDAHFAIGNFIRDALQGRPIRVRDGQPFRSYLYMADLAIWLWTILFRGVSCRPYNVGSDQEISIATLAKTVASVLASAQLVGPALQRRVPPPSVLHSPPVTATAVPSRYVPSIERARTELGLQLHVPLDDAIRRTARYASQVGA